MKGYKFCAKNKFLCDFTQFNSNLSKIIEASSWEGKYIPIFPNAFPHFL